MKKKKSEDNFCKKHKKPQQTNPAECKMTEIKQMHEKDPYKTAPNSSTRAYLSNIKAHFKL